MRHFNASYLLASGVDMATLSSRLGHSSKAFTLQTYAHMLLGGEEKAAAAANLLLTKSAASARRARR
jgi:site-specific recombinase XerD